MQLRYEISQHFLTGLSWNQHTCNKHWALLQKTKYTHNEHGFSLRVLFRAMQTSNQHDWICPGCACSAWVSQRSLLNQFRNRTGVIAFSSDGKMLRAAAISIQWSHPHDKLAPNWWHVWDQCLYVLSMKHCARWGNSSNHLFTTPVKWISKFLCRWDASPARGQMELQRSTMCRTDPASERNWGRWVLSQNGIPLKPTIISKYIICIYISISMYITVYL